MLTLNTITNLNKNSLPSSTIIIDKQPMNPEAFCKNINNYYASVGGVLADTSVEPAIVNSTELEPLCLGEVKRKKLSPLFRQKWVIAFYYKQQ